MTRDAQSFAEGCAEGDVLVLRDALSLWGGIDVQTGRVIDRSHPDVGACVAGTILVMPGGRGSSSSSSVLAESLRCGTGPVGIVLAVRDPILTVGALVAARLYGLRCPIVVADHTGMATGQRMRIEAPPTGPAQLTWL